MVELIQRRRCDSRTMNLSSTVVLQTASGIDLLPLGERPQHQRRQVAVLAQDVQILLVERLDHVLRVVLDNVRVRQDGYPVILPTLGRLDTVHAEAAGQAGDVAKDRLKRLGQMMR